MAKKKVDYIDGVHINTIRGLIRSPNVSPDIKMGWGKKLDRLGVKL